MAKTNEQMIKDLDNIEKLEKEWVNNPDNPRSFAGEGTPVEITNKLKEILSKQSQYEKKG